MRRLRRAAEETATSASPHRSALEALGLRPPALARLEAYLDVLATWSARVNLTGARTAEDRVRLLVGAVLKAAPLPAAGRLIDVGSGNGSPGLVLALLREDLEVTLLEPRARRWAFLREAARRAGPARPVSALRVRHDGYRGAAAATVVLRALALPLAELDPLVAPGGHILVLGGRPRPEPPFEEVPGPHPADARLFRRTVSRET